MVLYILGLFGLLLINTNKITNYLEENVIVILYFDLQKPDQEIKDLSAEIGKMKNVKQTRFVSREEAAFQYKEVLEEDFVEILGDNPLPASVEVYLNAEMSSKQREKIIGELRNLDGVDEVDFMKDLVSSIERNKVIVGNILIILAMLLVVVSLVLVNNTIRLSVYSRRFLVRSMQLVGATEWFIIKPFVIRSVLYVLVASVAAMVLTTITYFVVGGWVQQNLPGSGYELISFKVFTHDFQIYSLLFALLVALGLLIVIPGTYFATQKYLRLRIDELY